VHLVARRANGEQLGGSGIEIVFEGARFVLTSATNMGKSNAGSAEVDPYEEVAAFKKRIGNEYGERLVLSGFAIHPNYDGSSGCGFDIAVIKVASVVAGSLSMGAVTQDLDNSLSPIAPAGELTDAS